MKLWNREEKWSEENKATTKKRTRREKENRMERKEMMEEKEEKNENKTRWASEMVDLGWYDRAIVSGGVKERKEAEETQYASVNVKVVTRTEA